MNRSQRLLELLQLLRVYRQPVSASTLADKLEVTTRTIYRDINTLRQQGANIVGESGIGFVLVSDNHLPPLNLSIDEIHAVVLGLRWVKRHGDAQLADFSEHAYAKIAAVIPEHLQEQLLAVPLMVASAHRYSLLEEQHAEKLRQAINQEVKVLLTYQDVQEQLSQRVIYPLAIGFFDQALLCAAWCELREDFRHFRVDRILDMTLLEDNYYPNRVYLLRRWQREKDIADQ